MLNPPRRVVSLIASATEIVAALGCVSRLVARSHECDHPPDVLRLPAITRPKFKLGGTSGEIDARVREIVKQGLSVYEVDAEALRHLAPDLIITQDHCEVCAVGLGDVEAAVRAWAGCGAGVLSLRPDTFEAVLKDMRRVAVALGVEATGAALISDMQRRIGAIKAKLPGSSPKRVAFIEWADPLMSGGNWMPALIDMAGGVSCFGRGDLRSHVMEFADLAAADADAIIVAPCGYDLAAAARDCAALAQNPAWPSLPAVRRGRVFAADGNAYFNRPGPRLADTAALIAEMIHPEVFHPAHEGTGWKRMTT